MNSVIAIVAVAARDGRAGDGARTGAAARAGACGGGGGKFESPGGCGRITADRGGCRDVAMIKSEVCSLLLVDVDRTSRVCIVFSSKILFSGIQQQNFAFSAVLTPSPKEGSW